MRIAKYLLFPTCFNIKGVFGWGSEERERESSTPFTFVIVCLTQLMILSFLPKPPNPSTLIPPSPQGFLFPFPHSTNTSLPTTSHRCKATTNSALNLDPTFDALAHLRRLAPPHLTVTELTITHQNQPCSTPLTPLPPSACYTSTTTTCTTDPRTTSSKLLHEHHRYHKPTNHQIRAPPQASTSF